MTACYGFCILCRATSLYGARGNTICWACLRERTVPDSARTVGVGAEASRGRAAMLAGTERATQSRAATRPRPAIVRDVIGAALVVALPVVLWFVAALVAA